MLIYLHGFRSAPASSKACLLTQRLVERGLIDQFWCKQLPASPRQAITLIESTLRTATSQPVLVGSSLGGYYATWLAEQYDLRALLINPAAYAFRTLATWIGHHTNLFTGEAFHFSQQHIDELQTLWIPLISRPERFWLIVETGDEVLDYREAVFRYTGARQTIIEGGDHSLLHFPEWLDDIIDFALPEQSSKNRTGA